MIIIPFSGGLGNQLFQYAFSRTLIRYNTSHKIYYTDYLIRRDFAHNGYELNDLFGVETTSNFFINYLTRFCRKCLLLTKTKGLFFFLRFLRIYIREEVVHFSYDSSFMTAYKGINLYIGYWQSALYFQPIIDEITCKFTFSTEQLSDYSRGILHIVERCQSVSVHIRRGDYLSSANIDSVGFICDLSYYYSAMEYIKDRLDDVYFFVFSDEILWVEKFISGEKIIVVSGNSGKDAWQDMCLMSKCQHHIIANSTFSWWGTWLSQNEGKFVVAPSRFSRDIIDEDLIPSSWIRI